MEAIIRKAFIETKALLHLESYKNDMVLELIRIIENKQEKFKPYIENPSHYILSIYDPLELSYVVLGYHNYSITLNYQNKNVVNKSIVAFLKNNGFEIVDEYDKEVIQLKREIEYHFLSVCIKAVESHFNKQIQFYITQHITEVSFDLTNMQAIAAEYLWGNLEK